MIMMPRTAKRMLRQLAPLSKYQSRRLRLYTRVHLRQVYLSKPFAFRGEVWL